MGLVAPPSAQPPQTQHTRTPREQQAWDEAATTDISRPVAWLLVLFFAGLLAGVPLIQFIHEVRQGSLPSFTGPRPQPEVRGGERGLFAANARLLAGMKAYEDALAEDSVVNQAVRPWIQQGLIALGAGNEKGYLGRDGWLFFRPGIDYLTGLPFLDERVQKPRRMAAEESGATHHDPIRAVREFHADLEARGIRLVLVPVPDKAQIHPEGFAGGNWPVMPQNPDFARFVREVEADGVIVHDAGPALWQAARSGTAQFLPQDTHWTPQAMQAVAAAVAMSVRQRAGLELGEAEYIRQPATASMRGDIAVMLKLPPDQRRYQPENVALQQVGTLNDNALLLWTAQRGAAVLLLGDSFSNIYSMPEMGFGQAAGFAEQLAYELRQPVDTILQNDAGSHATRMRLSRELARGSDRLAGTKVVVWEFAIRELHAGTWKPTPLTLGTPRPSAMLALQAGESLRAKGVIERISPAPREGSAPYADHLRMALVRLEDGRQAVVLLRSMQDNRITPAGRLRAEQDVALLIRPYDEVSAAVDGFNKSALADLETELPLWAELETTP